VSLSGGKERVAGVRLLRRVGRVGRHIGDDPRASQSGDELVAGAIGPHQTIFCLQRRAGSRVAWTNATGDGRRLFEGLLIDHLHVSTHDFDVENVLYGAGGTLLDGYLGKRRSGRSGSCLMPGGATNGQRNHAQNDTLDHFEPPITGF